MEAGEIVTVPGPHDSIMAGLNCGRPSLIAWPIVSAGDRRLHCDSRRARARSDARLGPFGITAGETGAAGLAGLIELLTGPGNTQKRKALRLDERSCALIFVTEGATDPASYGRIVSGERG